jgi:hypothetical protein
MNKERNFLCWLLGYLQASAEPNKGLPREQLNTLTETLRKFLFELEGSHDEPS